MPSMPESLNNALIVKYINTNRNSLVTESCKQGNDLLLITDDFVSLEIKELFDDLYNLIRINNFSESNSLLDGVYFATNKHIYSSSLDDYAVNGIVCVRNGVYYAYSLGLKFSGLSKDGVSRLIASTIESISEIPNGSITENKLNAAVIQKLNSVTPDLLQFVTTLPTGASINTNAHYFVLNNKIFPDCSPMATNDFPTVAVSYSVADGYKLLRISNNPNAHVRTVYSFKSFNWDLWEENNGEWVKTYESEEANTAWKDAINFSNVIYSNSSFTSPYSPENLYNTSRNQTDIYGAPLDQSNPVYTFITYKYVNNAWVNIGISDLGALISIFATKAEIAAKQDTLVSGTNIKTINSTSLLGTGNINIPVPLVFNNLSVATTDWVADNTYSDYGYKAVLTCPDVTSSMIANVYLSSASANLKVIADFCEEGTDSVTIYATTNENAVTIKRIEVS